MKEKLEQRLKELRTEFESGQKALADLEGKQINLRNTLLRISGAIQVLEEELAKENESKVTDIGQIKSTGEERTAVAS
ncbi:MAG: hypothetical protein DWB56_14065 [Candidatus Jettenia sp.]|uniref:Uncharacterized protein n=1 Tax=Candidatus Jettenia caeni TaxID=247490 RepID=I3II97_9BACT|nr:hypothetical protein [Candidatus Jettenia sp. AMX1]MBC6930059.1 hypothetical protein [Candidatus Jettenia sp.]NUN21980.1 hypothetical protein [Candidatus Jettenia caeni]KAA0248166.1 MAG: hypothetical protein EDM77_13280 [Candidatus Jettenia sp. AMX1]MCE7881737.1 hypothetical protein [Candidatus Jettenia sp. AMX1]MCQ3928362.1 hypothetical protein [Candidatus Jettenia sp.]